MGVLTQQINGDNWELPFGYIIVSSKVPHYPHVNNKIAMLVLCHLGSHLLHELFSAQASLGNLW